MNKGGPLEVPERYRGYACQDYFHQGWAAQGHFDLPSQLWIIVPLAESYETAEGFFAIGRSGADGIDFGYRKGHPGLWAFHPIEREFQYLAATVAELVEKWCSGRLRV